MIQPLLPNKPRGVPRADDRKVLNGIYWRLRTGSPWADSPERHGPSTTCANRFRRWARIGLWDHLAEAMSKAYDGDIQMIDAAPIRVHQHGGNVKKGSARHPGRGSGPRSSRVHGALAGQLDHQDTGACHANSLPIAIKLTEGQAHDGRGTTDMLTGLKATQIVLGDRAYDINALRNAITAQGAWANIRPMETRIVQLTFSRFLCRYRNLVECFFSKLKHYRAVAIRYKKHAANDLAAVKLAATRIWLRHAGPVT